MSDNEARVWVYSDQGMNIFRFNAVGKVYKSEKQQTDVTVNWKVWKMSQEQQKELNFPMLDSLYDEITGHKYFWLALLIYLIPSFIGVGTMLVDANLKGGPIDMWFFLFVGFVLLLFLGFPLLILSHPGFGILFDVLVAYYVIAYALLFRYRRNDIANNKMKEERKRAGDEKSRKEKLDFYVKEDKT